MHLTRVTLPVADPPRAAAWYADVLDLPVSRTGPEAQVQVGRTALVLRASPPPPGTHHLAFTVPTGTLAAGKAWLDGRAPLLSRDGVDEFDTAPSWNARSVYFTGPEDSVLELIERRDLDHSPHGPFAHRPFSGVDLLCVSEVGIAVPDVRAVAAALRRDAGIEAYGDEPGEEFGAVGDVHGLLILVRAGRAWFPTTGRTVAAVPTVVEARGPRAGSYELGPGQRLDVRD